MKTSSIAALVALNVLLAACGGGSTGREPTETTMTQGSGIDGSRPAGAPPVAAAAVPVPDDRTEPLDPEGRVPPPSETAEPLDLG